jgi:hypothetical protein
MYPLGRVLLSSGTNIPVGSGTFVLGLTFILSLPPKE